MSFVTKRSNFRVEVHPRSPGDFGIFSISGQTRTEAEAERICEEIAQDIRRHVDNLPSERGKGVNVVWDSEKVCVHCGYDWSPDERGYNACCNKHVDEWEKEHGRYETGSSE